MKKYIISALAGLIALSLQGQDLEWAKRLYQNGMYSEALKEFQGVPGTDAHAARVICGLGLGSENALADAEAFVQRNPESLFTPQVYYLMGLEYFDMEKYEQSLSCFNAVQAKDLFPSQAPEYTYKLGFSAYGVGEWDRCKTILSRMRSLPENDFTAPAYYTIGYICYAESRFRDALSWFELAAKDPRFEGISNYYILECRFNEKDYAYVVDFGEELFPKIPSDRQPHMARIMSESYLILGDADKARAYYEENLRNRAARTRSDFYYSGEVLYTAEDWQGSIESFTQMGNRSDSLGQLASYKMGYANIQLKNKVEAMERFKEASALDFSPEIKEDALYNYAKLAFDLGGDTAPFRGYLDTYGTKAKGDAVYSYIAMAALKNHDYAAAVDAYDNVENLDPAMQSNYMKAYLLRAMELMEIGSWRAAAPLLKAAAYYSPKRDGFNQLTRYYLAEAYYRDGKYDEARSILKDLYNMSALSGREEGKLVNYHIAYTYFREANYTTALRWFNNYLASGSVSAGADAQTRVADCYFFSGNYPVAVNAYERRISEYPDPSDLYPYYRAGLAAGLMGDDSRKIGFLENAKQVRPDTPYYGESMFELGKAYVAVNDREDAERTFKALHAATTDPGLSARALLELGTLARGDKDKSRAMDYYKQVVDMGGTYTEDALLAIESLYRSGEDPDAYIAYLATLGDKASRTERQKEEVYFSSAEQIYLSGDYTKALSSIGTYLETYPNAVYAAKAHFYKAECYRNLSQTELSADEYLLAINYGLDGAMAESATLNYANANYALGNYTKAYNSYQRLIEIAKFPENVSGGTVGMMRSAYAGKDWEQAIACASAVDALHDADADLRRETSYIRAKSLLLTSRRTEALEVFRSLASQPSTPEGAEASYILIQDAYDRADFDGIRASVYDFAGKAGDQAYWLAKAFIVLGDTFAEEGNFQQAKATFQSIKEGYTPSGSADDIFDQVDLRLRKL